MKMTEANVHLLNLPVTTKLLGEEAKVGMTYSVISLPLNKYELSCQHGAAATAASQARMLTHIHEYYLSFSLLTCGSIALASVGVTI